MGRSRMKDTLTNKILWTQNLNMHDQVPSIQAERRNIQSETLVKRKSSARLDHFTLKGKTKLRVQSEKKQTKLLHVPAASERVKTESDYKPWCEGEAGTSAKLNAVTCWKRENREVHSRPASRWKEARIHGERKSRGATAQKRAAVTSEKQKRVEVAAAMDKSVKNTLSDEASSAWIQTVGCEILRYRSSVRYPGNRAISTLPRQSKLSIDTQPSDPRDLRLSTSKVFHTTSQSRSLVRTGSYFLLQKVQWMKIVDEPQVCLTISWWT